MQTSIEVLFSLCSTLITDIHALEWVSWIFKIQKLQKQLWNKINFFRVVHLIVVTCSFSLSFLTAWESYLWVMGKKSKKTLYFCCIEFVQIKTWEIPFLRKWFFSFEGFYFVTDYWLHKIYCKVSVNREFCKYIKVCKSPKDYCFEKEKTFIKVFSPVSQLQKMFLAVRNSRSCW